MIFDDFGLFLAWCAAWLAAAAAVRMTAGRVYDWMTASLATAGPAGYIGVRRGTNRGRHVAARRTAAPFEVGVDCEVAPYAASLAPLAADADVHDIGDGTEYAAELHAIVEQIRAEETGEVAPLPLSGDADETVAFLQERTVVLPVLDLHAILAARATAAEFDALVDCDYDHEEDDICLRCIERELLAEERTRLERLANTGSFPLVGAR